MFLVPFFLLLFVVDYRYLIHWPGASGLQPGDPKNKKQRLLTWKILSKLKKEGHLRSAGVSNFLVKHLEELVDDPEYDAPAVNQVIFDIH